MSNRHFEYPESFAMCPECTGTGKKRCGLCNGSGRHTQTRYEYDRDGRSISRLEDVNCSSCAGEGDRSCSRCAGTGSVMKTRSSRQEPKREASEPGGRALKGATADEKIEALYDESLASAREAQEELIEEIGNVRAKCFPRAPLVSPFGDLGKVDPKVDERYAKARDWYSELSRWVGELDPAAEKTHGEVTAAIARLKEMGQEDVAFYFGSLESRCSTVASYARMLGKHKPKG